MGGYILKRLLLMVPTLFGVMLITFAITQFVPGGPVERLVAQLSGYGAGGDTTSGGLYQGNKGLDQERVEQLKKLYGFDQPPLTRFLTMMRQYLVFDFGHSYYHHRSVSELVVSKLPVSMSLGLWTFVIVYSVCIPLGIAKAVRDGSAFDVATSTLILVGYAIPGFVLGIVLIVLFGGGSFFNLFPLRGAGLGQLAPARPGGQNSRLPLAHGPAHHRLHRGQPGGHDPAHQELLSRGDPQAVRGHGPGQGAGGGAGALPARVPQRHHPDHHRLPGSFITAFFTGSLLIETISSRWTAWDCSPTSR